MRLFVCFFIEDVAAVNPHFDTDDSVRKVCLFAGEIDIRTQGLQRYATALYLFGAGHFRSPETARDSDAHTLHVTICHHLLHGLLQDAAEGLAFLQTLGDHVGYDGWLRFSLPV